MDCQGTTKKLLHYCCIGEPGKLNNSCSSFRLGGGAQQETQQAKAFSITIMHTFIIHYTPPESVKFTLTVFIKVCGVFLLENGLNHTFYGFVSAGCSSVHPTIYRSSPGYVRYRLLYLNSIMD